VDRRILLALSCTLLLMGGMAVATGFAVRHMLAEAPEPELAPAAPEPEEPALEVEETPEVAPEEAPEPAGDTGETPEVPTTGESSPFVATPRKTRPQTSKPPAKKKKKKRCPNYSGVTKHSPTRYTLSNGFVERYIRDMDRASRQGSASWATSRSGKKVGLRLTRVACAPRAAGFKRRDVVYEVDGRDITSLTAAWASYRSVKKAGSFKVKLRRGGENMVIRYSVKK